MYSFTRPDESRIRHFRTSQSALSFNYVDVHATRNSDAPAGWTVDRNAIRLGEGRSAFEAACEALTQWRQFDLDWMTLHRDDAPPEEGQTVVVLARVLGGLYVLNACRVVYTIDTLESPRRFGYAYGTLPAHAESGEERFQIEWRDDDSVWYEIFAFSRPHTWLARAGYPYVRAMQKRFARDSLRAMQQSLDSQVSAFA